MIGDFYKAFVKDEKSRVLPRKVVEELNKELPDGYHYTVDKDTQKLIGVPYDDKIAPSFSFDLNPEKYGIPEGLPSDRWMDYFYRTQKTIELDPYIRQGDKRFLVSDLYIDPIAEQPSGQHTAHYLIPHEFPAAQPMVFGLSNGEQREIMIRRLPFDDMTHMKFGNVSFPALKVEWIVPDDPELIRSKKEHARISVSASPSKAETVSDALFSLQCFKAFLDGSLLIAGKRMGRTLDAPSAGNYETLDEQISGWTDALLLEELLHVQFSPGADFPEEDRVFFSELLSCLRDGKELVYKSPFSSFHIEIDKTAPAHSVESLVGPDAKQLKLLSEYPVCTLLGAQFPIFETLLLPDVVISKVAKDEDGNGAEIYLSESSPWTLVKKYSLTEADAEEAADALCKKYAPPSKDLT